MTVYRIIRNEHCRTKQEKGFFTTKAKAVYAMLRYIIPNIHDYKNIPTSFWGSYFEVICNKRTDWKEKQIEYAFHSQYTSIMDIYKILLHNTSAKVIIKGHPWYIEEVEVQ